jgi:hypothetical protein
VEEPLFSKGTLAGFRKRPIERTAGRIGQLVAANTGLAPITTAIGPENSPARPDPVSRRAGSPSWPRWVPTATAAPILDASMTCLSIAWRNGGLLTLDIFRSTPVVHALS